MPVWLELRHITDMQVTFTHKQGSKWLKVLRERCAREGRESIDLTAEPCWRAYVCSHPERITIISASGIIHFEGRFLNSPEPNARELNLPAPFGRYRFDFIAWRGNGTACRMHPSRQNEA